MVSGFEEYSEDIQNSLDRLFESRGKSYEDTYRECMYLKNYATNYNDIKLLGMVNYYLGECCYYNSEYNDILKYLTEGLIYQEQCEMYDLMARSHNLLGIIYQNNRNYAIALDEYGEGADIAKKHDLYYIYAMLNVNMAELHQSIHNYKGAIDHYLISEEYFKMTPGDNPFYFYSLLNACLSVAPCYVETGQIEEAEKCVNKAIAYYNEAKEKEAYMEDCMYQVYITVLYRGIGKTDLYRSNMEKTIEELSKTDHILEFYEYVIKLCNILLEDGYYDEFNRTLKIFEDKIKAADIPNIMMYIQRLKLKYNWKMEEKEKYIENAHSFTEYFDRQQNKQLEDIGKIIELKADMQKIKKDNAILKVKSEQDPLTGLPNRAGFNAYSEEKFEEACKNGTLFGVAIIDIDFFKQYNDRYGHLAGDDCIKAVADVLKTVAGKDVFAARYGGDEFVVIFTNKDSKEIRNIIKDIKGRVASLRLENPDSEVEPYITLSQGAFVRMPIGVNKLWDFMSKADNVLYRVKKYGRNSYRVVDDFKKN